MSLLAITGYASLDYVLTVAGDIVPDRTTHTRRDATAWPRPGGCPTYIARAVAQVGQASVPVMWLGDDAEAETLIAWLHTQGVRCSGLAQVPAARSPSAVLAYGPDGGCACLYDPGPAGRETLSAPQRQAIEDATHLCISVGPGHLTQDILDLRRPATRLYWAVKDDPACFSPQICARLSAEANVIFCSAAERGLIGDTKAVIVQTKGAQGVVVEMAGRHADIAVTPITVTDTTGAGDTFAGGFIAAEMAGEGAPEVAAQSGLDAARALLERRQRIVA